MALCYRYTNAEKCVNCGWNMLKVNKFSRFDFRVGQLPAPERDLLTSWHPTVDNLNERPVCCDCVILVRGVAEAEGGDKGPPSRSALCHAVVCAACGDSIVRRRWRPIDLQRPEHAYIFQEYLKVPVKADMKVCGTCIKHCQRLINKQRKSVQEIPASPDDGLVTEAENLQSKEQKPSIKQLRSGDIVTIESGPALTQPQPTPAIQTVREVTVDGYTKVIGKRGGICAACEGTAVRRLDLPTRQQLLLSRKVYITSSARVCDEHRIASDWTNIESTPCTFTGGEIADMVFLLKANWPIDFDNLEDLDPFVMNQWFGMTHEHFQQAFEKTELKEREGGKVALAVYLAHKHTGECATVLASLCERPRGVVEAALNMATEIYSLRPKCETAV